ncbi:MAG TPA: CHAT domain-containing protein [Spirochaetota bacterium]|nr:CHAT domain-containing protein [Spirochaetota bacterium]
MQQKIVYLNKEKYELLANSGRLAAEQGEFCKNICYYFLTGNYLCGKFYLQHSYDGQYYFRRRYFRRYYYYYPFSGPLSESEEKKIFKLLFYDRKKNKPVSICLNSQGNCLQIYWHSFSYKGLIGKYDPEMSAAVRKTAGQLAQIEPAFDLPLTVLKEKGYLVYKNILPASLHKVLNITDTIYLINKSGLNFNLLYNGTSFLGLSHTVINFFKTTPGRPVSAPKIVLAGPSYKADREMKKEENKLKNIFAAFAKVKCSLVNDFYKVQQLIDLLENCDLLHFIGHADFRMKQGLLLAHGLFFNTTVFKRVRRVPELLILSCCGNVPLSFKQVFFSKGGKLLIYNNAPVTSRNFFDFYASFYWQVFNKKQRFDRAFRSIKLRSFKKDNNWLAMEMAGNANWRLLR